MNPFQCGYPVFLLPLVEEIILSPLYSLGTLVNEKVYFWALYCLYVCLYASTLMGIFKFFFVFFFFLQQWVSLAARGLSIVVVSGGCSSLQCRLLMWWLLSCCRAEALGMEGRQL